MPQEAQKLREIPRLVEDEDGEEDLQPPEFNEKDEQRLQGDVSFRRPAS